MHSYECVKYSGLGNSNWNCQVIYNSLVKATTYFDRTSHFHLFAVGHSYFLARFFYFISILFIDIDRNFIPITLISFILLYFDSI